MKWIVSLLFTVAVSVSAHAQVTRMELFKDRSTTGASRSFDNGADAHQGWILSVYPTGGPTTCTIAFEESDDNGVADAWANVTATAGSSNPYTCTATGRVVYSGFSRWLRANLTALSGGTAPTVTVYLTALSVVQVGNVLGVTQGGTGTGTAFTAGSVVFAGASGNYAQDNANLFWDDAANELGVGGTPGGDTIRATTAGATLIAVNTTAAGAANPSFIMRSGGTRYWDLSLQGGSGDKAFFLYDNIGARKTLQVFSNGGGYFGASPVDPGANSFKVEGSVIMGNGGNVASAGTVTLPAGNLFHITGTTTITTLNTCDSTNNGRQVMLIFDGILTFTDGSNLILAGNFATTANDTITLACDGTNWYELARSVN